MCGRFTLNVNKNTLDQYLQTHFAIEMPQYEFSLPRFNIAPSQPVLAIINDGVKNRIGTLKWGYVPNYTLENNTIKQLINARAESIATKPSFSKAFKYKRCVILADSFYEWNKVSKTKAPYRFLVKNQDIFAFAGIWGAYIQEDGTKVYTCAIITTEANSLMANVHNRMPVILSKEMIKVWLDPSITNDTELLEILQPYQASLMDYYPVSSLVNNAQFDNPKCIEKVDNLL